MSRNSLQNFGWVEKTVFIVGYNVNVPQGRIKHLSCLLWGDSPGLWAVPSDSSLDKKSVIGRPILPSLLLLLIPLLIWTKDQ